MQKHTHTHTLSTLGNNVRVKNASHQLLYETACTSYLRTNQKKEPRIKKKIHLKTLKERKIHSRVVTHILFVEFHTQKNKSSRTKAILFFSPCPLIKRLKNKRMRKQKNTQTQTDNVCKKVTKKFFVRCVC